MEGIGEEAGVKVELDERERDAAVDGCTCGRPRGVCTCGHASGDHSVAMSSPYVYVLGRIEPRFTTLAAEREYVQARARHDTAAMTDHQALRAVLSDPENRYLARMVCWILRVDGLEAYILQPRESAELDLLLQGMRAEPRSTDVDVVIGLRGGLAPPELCNGLTVPMVNVDHVYAFSRQELLAAIPRPHDISQEEFEPAAEELLDRIMQLTANVGASDEHRALNYLAVRYPGIYAHTARAFVRNQSLAAVEVQRSMVSEARRIVDAIFTFVDRATDVAERAFVRVDVTEEFPFLVSKMTPYLLR